MTINSKKSQGAPDGGGGNKYALRILTAKLYLHQKVAIILYLMTINVVELLFE